MEFGVFYKNNFEGNYISISSIGAGTAGCEVFDIHGNQGDRGTVASEIYHNAIDVGLSGTNRWLNHRGGKAIIANNSVTRNIGFIILKKSGNLLSVSNECTKNQRFHNEILQ